MKDAWICIAVVVVIIAAAIFCCTWNAGDCSREEEKEDGKS